jgi:hypothetical protein
MTVNPHTPAIVAVFLRQALAGGTLGVPELEAKARAAGLLSEGQRISHAKVFKRAKKALGIRSVRNGFGASGEWLWVLDKLDVPPIADGASASRVPLNWIEGVAALHHRRHPTAPMAPVSGGLQQFPDRRRKLGRARRDVRLGYSRLIRLPQHSPPRPPWQRRTPVGHQRRQTRRAISRLGRYRTRGGPIAARLSPSAAGCGECHVTLERASLPLGRMILGRHHAIGVLSRNVVTQGEPSMRSTHKGADSLAGVTDQDSAVGEP